jgi:hypothetical protein
MPTARMLVSGRVIGAAALIAAALVAVSAWRAMGQTLPFDSDDITGVVTSASGPEAGVWVIAETTDLPTKYVKIVVTDDQGRYLLPDLPNATYTVWSRGYGLVDSPRVRASPGRVLDLPAIVAPNPLEAAQYYPAGYWYSLANVPAASEFPGTGPDGNGIEMTTQQEWLFRMKMGGGSCGGSCHNVGMRSMREIPEPLLPLGSYGAWSAARSTGRLA